MPRSEASCTDVVAKWPQFPLLKQPITNYPCIPTYRGNVKCKRYNPFVLHKTQDRYDVVHTKSHAARKLTTIGVKYLQYLERFLRNDRMRPLWRLESNLQLKKMAAHVEYNLDDTV